MARIRRSSLPIQLNGKKYIIWRIAVYIRLSKDDGNDESMSITNQRKIILEFIEDKFGDEDYVLVDFYIDDGRSGTTEETRPDFQRMVGDIEAGKVNCVICKTLSRCFRNYSDQGRFLEQFLPAHRCRFIATSNPYVDTYADPDCTSNMEIPINGLMNDRYAAKTSADVRRTFDTKRRRGEFIGAFAPYGYLKDPENKNALVIDEDTAPIVRDIFHWFVHEGMKPTSIAKRLNTLGILNPSAHKYKIGLLHQKGHRGRDNDGLWTHKTVRDVLRNQVYIGSMVQGRQAIISYKVHKRYETDPEDWYVVENTHEPIIDRPLFDKAQGLLQRDTRVAPGRQNVYLFSGFLRCADCGKAMIRGRSKNFTYYTCRTYKEKGKDKCTRHSMRGDVLEQAVLVTIQKQIELVASLSELVEEINNAPVVSTKSNRLNALMRQKTQELDKTNSLLDGLYMDMKAGDITREQYRRMREKLEQQAAQLRSEVSHIQEEQDTAAQGISTGNPYLNAFLKHRNIQSLSRGLLVELVKFIYIHEDGSIDIEFNFQDQYRRIVEFVENNQKELYVLGGKAVS
ncbi:MAG: recombinase family protein [Oscillospiraceae bacterium]|jgi:site-specific DNA recombinase|nr:recombinase family protein [Oscillospiraceae bacterium]